MSKEMRKLLDDFKTFNNRKLNEGINERYLPDEDDQDSSEIIEGHTIYNDYLINYKVEYHEDFGYSFMEITSDEVDEYFIEDNYDEITDQITRELTKPSKSYSPPKYKYIIIDTRTGREIATRSNHISRDAASEIYDIPKSFIEIKMDL